MKNILALLLTLFLAVVVARRSSGDLQKEMGGLGSYPSSYPYGWGLDGPHMKCEEPPEEGPHKAGVKQVKLVTSKKRALSLFRPKKEEPPVPHQHPLCGVEHVEEAEELMDQSLE